MIESLLVSVFVLLVAGPVVWMSIRLAVYRPGSAVRPAEDGSFDPDYYAPMQNLLSGADEKDLVNSGASPREIAAFRAERRDLLRLYLRELAGDFHALHKEARQLVAVAPEEHADLVGLMLKQTVSFWSCMLRIEFDLTAEHIGLHRADPTRILGVVGQLGQAVARATAVPGPVPVA